MGQKPCHVPPRPRLPPQNRQCLRDPEGVYTELVHLSDWALLSVAVHLQTVYAVPVDNTERHCADAPIY